MKTDLGVGSVAKNSHSTLESLRIGLSLFRPFGKHKRASSESVAAGSNNDEYDSSSLSNSQHQHKIGHRRVDEAGQITYKRCPLVELRAALQLGVECAVASAQAKCQRDVLLQDFSQTMMFEFPAAGSRITPAHCFKDFTFKAYAPVAFQHFRNKFGIKSSDFLVSLCKDEWRDLPNPGASGSVFYLSSDDRFIIKTVQAKEARFLLQLLPGYYMNLIQNPETLLPKFFGLYCYQRLDKNIRVIVMNNLIPSNVTILEKYDLKGSSYKRRASEKERKKEIPTLKDLDFRDKFPSGLQMEPRVYNRLLTILQKDLRVLSSFEIMDYSLLIGIAMPRSQSYVGGGASNEVDSGGDNVQSTAECGSLDRRKACGGNMSPLQTAKTVGTPPRIRKSDSPAKMCCRLLSSTEYDNCATVEGVHVESVEAMRNRRSWSHLESRSVGLPRTVVHPVVNIAASGLDCYHQNKQMVVYVGIIDILQCYELKKRLEHALKTTVLAMEEISICHPRQYATRFYRFLSRTAFQKRIGIYRLPPSYDSMTLTSASHFSSYMDTVNTQPTFHSEDFASINTRSSCSSLNSSRHNTGYTFSPWWSPPLTAYAGSTIDRDSGVHTNDSQRSKKKR